MLPSSLRARVRLSQLTTKRFFVLVFGQAGSTAIDSSGNGRHGTIGNMATTENQLQYSTGRASQVPGDPVRLPSTAPTVEVGVPTVYLTVSGANEIELRSSDPDNDDLLTTISSLPTSGTITTMAGGALAVDSNITDGSRTNNKRVIYTPTNFATFVSDSFTYKVSDGGVWVQATIQLDKYTVPAPSAKSYSFNEDVLSTMVLGKAYVSATRKYTQNMNVVITSLPARGTLYQACFRAGGDGLYTALCDASSTNKVAITTVPTTVSNSRGIIMFQPASNEFGATYASFDYKYVDPDVASLSSATATVSIGVASVNDSPTGTSQTATVEAGATHIFTLASSDADEDSTNAFTYAPSFGPHAFARISTFAKAGRLSQVVGTAATTPFDSTVTSVPIVSSWTSEVVRFSSQFSKCNAGACFIWSGAEDTGCNQANTGATSTCRGADCAVPYGEEIVWGTGGCSEYAWQANQIIGPADFYPGYGDTALGYDLSAENSGREWIELKFPTNVYVTGFELYETYKPGATYRISTAPEYVDNNLIACCGQDFPAGGNCDGRPVCSTDTAWNTAWSGTAGNSGESATIFSPNMCPYAYQTNIVRVDLNTALASGWNNFDAAKVFGSLEMPPGLILADSTDSNLNKVAYTALPGMHGVDTFAYEVTDCLGYGAPTTMTVMLPEPATAFSAAVHKSFSVIVNGTTTSIPTDLSVPIESGIFSLHELLRGSATGVKVLCKGISGFTSFSIGGVVCESAGTTGAINTRVWSAQPEVIATGTGHAEVWLQKNESTITQRVQFHVCEPMHMAFIDTTNYGSASTCTSCLDADTDALGPLDLATYNTLCRSAVEAERERLATESQNMLTMIIIILAVVIGLIFVIVTWRAVKFLRKVIKSHKEQIEFKRERCRKAVSAAVTMQSSCYLITYDTFINMGGLKTHEVARDNGLLTALDSYEDFVEFASQNPIIFFSHQWLAWDHPDPDNKQYDEMIASIGVLCQKHGYQPEKLYIFLDYASIPQKNMRLRLCAIDALGVISSVAHFFIVIAPDAVHKDTKIRCNKASYARRGWCRLEQWGHLSTMGMENMFFYDGTKRQLMHLDDTPDNNDDWFLDSIMVFEGDYTNPENKKEMLDVVMGLYAMAVTSKNGATKRLNEMITEHFYRVFPVDVCSDLPEMLMNMMKANDSAIHSTLQKSKTGLAPPKAGVKVLPNQMKVEQLD